MRNDDYEEFADRINGQISIDNFKNREDYVKAVRNFFDKKGLKAPSVKQIAVLWGAKGTDVKVKQKKLFESARGTNLARDRGENARVIVTDIDKYREIGARRSDLKGLDTKRSFGYTRVKGIIRRRMIDVTRTKYVKYPATYQRKYKGKIITVNVKKRERIFIFDKKGRRISPTRPMKKRRKV